LDLAAEVIQSSEQAPDRLGAIAAREVIGAKIFVFEHVPSGIEHRGGDRENGFFDAAASFEAEELGLQVETCAVSSLTPGIVVSRRVQSSIGAKVFPTSASTVARACWSESMSPKCSLSKRR
jgi:hypothetical protein